MAARIRGLSNIIAIDVNESRLALAKELGANSTIRVGEVEDLAAEIQARSNGGVHYSLDTSGNTKALRTAFESLRAMGVCGMIAPGPPGSEVRLVLTQTCRFPFIYVPLSFSPLPLLTS